MKSVRWTEKELEEFMKNKNKSLNKGDKKNIHEEEQNLASSLISIGLGDKIKDSKTKSKTVTNDKNAKPKEDKKAVKKKTGTNTKPIFDSLVNSNPTCAWGKDWFSVNIEGGRILTYNQLYSILQYRKYEAFKYKKICKEVITRACKNPENKTKTKKPFFDGPTRLSLIRVGTKEMDRDALPVVFKYFLDSLKNEGVIDDDNPNIIVDIITYQKKGEPRLSMLLERLTDWEEIEVPEWSKWKKFKKK